MSHTRKSGQGMHPVRICRPGELPSPHQRAVSSGICVRRKSSILLLTCLKALKIMPVLSAEAVR